MRKKPTLHPPVTMLNVPDLQAAIRWYEGIGFEVAELQPQDSNCSPNWALLAYGKATLMLSAGGNDQRPKNDSSLYFRTDQVDALYAQMKDQVEVQYEPRDQFYGMRDFWVLDLNGFILGFGQTLQSS